MTGLDALLAQHGSGLVLALSCLLGVGALAMLSGRSPLHRQRVAELTLAAALLACGLLLLPLPRPGLSWLTAGGDEQLHAPVTETGAKASAAMPLSLPVAQQVSWERAVPSTLGMRSELPDASLFPGAPRLLAQLFLLGAAGFAAHLLLSFVLLRRTLRRAADAPAWVQRLTSGSEPGDSPRVLLANGISRPFCCGLGRGTIVLPVQLAQPALRARVEAVLAHERAHLSQRHPRARLLASLVSPFLYWHPLYWWLARELRRCSELLADDMAAGRLDKRLYVAEFLELAESCSRVPAPQALGLGALGPRKDFLIRMETLLMRRTRLSTRSSVLHITTRSLCAVLLLGSVSLAWGRPPQEGLPAAADRLNRLPTDQSASLVGQNQKLPVHSYSLPDKDQPGLVATLQFEDPRALGEFMLACYDAGLTVELLDMSAPAGASGRRTGRAAVRSPRGTPLGQILGFQIPGLSLVAMEYHKQQRVAAAPPRNPLAQRVDRMQQDLAELQDQIARLEALRADFRGREVDLSKPIDSSDPIDPATGMLGTLLADPAIGLPRELGPLRVDLATGVLMGQYPLEIVTGERSPAAIQGIVVSATRGEQNLVAIKCGTTQGVDVGQIFEVYRDSTYKGRVRIVSVAGELCIGVIELQIDGTKMEAGDKATTRL